MITRYIADLHLYDRASINWRMSDFSIEENLIDQWNFIVQPDDVTFIVGDIGLQCPFTYNVIRQLNGYKILIMGNHDMEWDWTPEARSLFDGIHYHLHSGNLLLIHDPKDAPEYRNKGDWVIHGHYHTYDAEVLAHDHVDYVHDMRRFNCALDMNCLHPITLQELMYNKTEYVLQHPI